MSKRGLYSILIKYSNNLFNLGAVYRCDSLTKVGSLILCSLSFNERPSYHQPHNIKYINSGNSALDSKLIEREHGLLKRRAKYRDSKESKRLY